MFTYSGSKFVAWKAERRLVDQRSVMRPSASHGECTPRPGTGARLAMFEATLGRAVAALGGRARTGEAPLGEIAMARAKRAET